MDSVLVLRIVLALVGLLWPLVILWNRHLHNSLTRNREDVQDVKLDLAKNYVSHDQMDKFFAQMEKRFDRLEEKIDSK